MAFSYVQYTGDDSTTLFNVPFAYILKEHVKVYEDGVEYAAFTWNSDTVISITPAPAAGVTVRIVRETPVDAPLVDYVDGTVLTEQSLDLNTQQMLFISQEAKDKANNSIIPNSAGQWDGQSLRGEDFADPVNPQDLATKNYVDTGMESQVAAAAASAASAASSATSASSHATNANTYRGEALSHKNAAVAAQTAAETAETNTASSQSNTANSASAAATSATKAAGSAANAATEASNAATSAAAAATSKNGADTAKTAAQAAQAGAELAESNAQVAQANAEAARDSAISQASAIGQLYSFKNKVINGDFRVSNRSGALLNLNSGGIVAEYFTDRWKGVIWSADADFDNQGFFTMQKNYHNYCQVTVRTNNVVASIDQTLEDPRRIWGNTVTLSCWMRGVGSDVDISMRVKQNMGNGSGSSAQTHGQTVTAKDGVWERHSVTFVLPPTSDFDTRNDASTTVSLAFEAGITGTIQVSAVQLEIGNEATGFEFRPDQVERTLCNRYFYRVRTKAQTYDGGNSDGNWVCGQTVHFPCEMRTTPTATIETVHATSSATAAISSTTRYSCNVYAASTSNTAGKKRVDATVAFDADY